MLELCDERMGALFSNVKVEVCIQILQDVAVMRSVMQSSHVLSVFRIWSKMGVVSTKLP